MSKNDLRSQTLDLLRFPLAVVVLMIHVFSTGGIIFQGQTTSFDSYPIVMGVNRFIDGFLRGQSVPIYYFISGYVFFLGVEMTKATYLRKFKNRVKSLLIPYIVWNGIAILMLILTLSTSFSQYTAHKSVFTPSLEGFLSCFWVYSGSLANIVMPDAFYPLNVPLWFVRDLIIIVLFTPLLHFIVKKTKYYGILILGLLWFFCPYTHIQTYGFDQAIFFFAWGAYMSINRKDMLQFFGHFFKASVVLYILLGIAHIWATHNDYMEIASVIKRLNVLVGLFFAYNFASWLLRRGICKVSPFLASASFFIYVSHILICGKILKLLFVGFAPATNWAILLVYTLAVVLTVLLLLGTFYLMRQYTPRLLKVVAGRK